MAIPALAGYSVLPASAAVAPLQPERDQIAAAASASLPVAQADVPSVALRSYVLFDRHVEKNGGGSMTAAFQASSCEYFGYGIYEPEWEAIRQRVADGNATLCVNAHSV